MQGKFLNLRSFICMLSLVTFLIVSVDSVQKDIFPQIKKEQKHSNSQKEEKEAPTLSQLSIEAIVHVLKMEVPASAFEPVQFSVDEVLVCKHFYQVCFPLSSYLKNLLTCIISPNAP